VCLLPQVGAVTFDRQGVANHASQLAANIQGNLKRSLESIGVVSETRGWV
jgi:dihydrolipoamide dehydrogenase